MQQELCINTDDIGWDTPRRRIIECREWGELELATSELYVNGRVQLYEDISGSKYLRVHLKDDKIIFTATHLVGHIPLNDHLALNVIPRVNINNLTRLIRIARHSPVVLERFVRTYLAENEPLPSIFDNLVSIFIESVEEIVRRGLMTSYIKCMDETCFPRGRVLLNQTAHRHHARGMRFKVSSTLYERSLDNVYNRLLKYTMWLIERRSEAAIQRKGVARLRTKLNRYYRIFNDVHLDTSRRFLQNANLSDISYIPTARLYYAQAIQLALLLVEDNSLNLNRGSGSINAPSLTINLQEAFESYLRNILADNFSGEDSPLQIFDGNYGSPTGAKKSLFDDVDSHPATPDIVIRTSGQEAQKNRVIIEIKYKENLTREDINQTIAYGVSYRCPIVVLAYISSTGKGGHLLREGRIGPMVVYRYAYDLSGNLENEEKLFVSMMATLAAGSL